MISQTLPDPGFFLGNTPKKKPNEFFSLNAFSSQGESRLQGFSNTYESKPL